MELAKIENELREFITRGEQKFAGLESRLAELEAAWRASVAAAAKPKVVSDGVWLDPDAVGEIARGVRRSAPFTVPGGLPALMRKSVVSLSALGIASSPGERMPGVAMPPIPVAHARQIFTVVPTEANAVEYIRTTAVSGDISPQVEGQTKPETSLTFEAKLAPVRTIATWIPVTRQALEDVAGLQAYIEAVLTARVLLTEDREIFTGSGSGSHIEGLTAQAQTFDTSLLPSSYDHTTILGLAASQIEAAGGLPPNVAIVHPADYWRIRMLRERLTGGYLGAYIFGPPNTDQELVTVFGMRLVRSPVMTEGNFLVGNSTPEAVVIRERGSLTVEISTEHSTYFVQNMVAVKAETRIALCVFRPDSWVVGSFEISP